MTTPTAAQMRDLYIAAEAALLQGQAFSWGDRTLTRANLAEVREGRQEWERKAAAQTAVASGYADHALADFRVCR